MKYISPEDANKMSDADIKALVSSQVTRWPEDFVRFEKTNVSNIRFGDTVVHHGQVKTVCKDNIKYGGFMGSSLWGDSYRSGMDPAIRILVKS